MTREPPTETPPAGASGPRAWWQGLSLRQRRTLRAILAVLVLVILVVSALLARFLSAENIEREDEVALISAETRGDVDGMLEKLVGCRASPSCVAAVKANTRNPRLLRSGAVKVLQLESPTAYSLAGATGRTRLAWTVIGKLPVVQCVDVRRTGNFLSGIHVELIGLSVPIPNEGKCRKETMLEKEEEEATEVELGRSPAGG